MTYKEKLALLDVVMAKINFFLQYKEVSLEAGERDALGKLAAAMYPNKMNFLSCGSCVGELLVNLYSSYSTIEELAKGEDEDEPEVTPPE